MPWVKTQQGAPVFQDEKGLVHLKDFEGKVQAVKPGEASKLLGDNLSGFSAASAEDLNAARQAAAESKTSMLGAAARGAVIGAEDTALAIPKLVTALGSAALGTSDPLAHFSGRQFLEDAAAVGAHFTGGESEVAAREEREKLLADTEAHPYATGAGELAGSLPLMLTGGGALEAAGARAAGALGMGARAARLAGSVGGSVLAGAGMGASAASESAWVKNSPLTAEQSLSSIGLGALFGGASTLALAGAGKLAPSIARALGKAAPEAEGLEGTAARLETEATAGEPSVLEQAAKPAPAEMESVPDSMVTKARRWLNDESDEAAVDAISRGNKPALKALGGGEAPTVEAKRQTGALLHEMGVLAPGRSEADMLQIAQQKATENGQKMGSILDELDKNAGYVEGEGLVSKLLDKAHEFENDSKLSWGPEGQELASFARARIAKVEEKANAGILTHSDLHDFRMYLDSLSKWQRGATTPASEAARDMRKIVSDALKDEIAKADPGLRKEWDVANQRFAAARWAEDTLSERVQVRSGANRMFSPSDYGTAAATVLAGHPVLAVAAGLGNKLLRQRGYSTFSAVAKRLAGGSVDVGAAPAESLSLARKIQTLVAHSAEQTEGHVSQFLGTPRDAVVRSGRQSATLLALRSADVSTAQSAYRDHAKEVQLVASNPDVTQQRLAKITGDTLPTVAPGLNADMASVAVRGAQYLAANMPAAPTNPESITPQLDEPPPVGHADLARYADRVEGVQDPISLLRDLNNGYVSPEKRDAVQAVWPQIFENMRQTVFTHLAELNEPVPHNKRVLLDLALDGKGSLEPSLRPQSLSVMRLVNEQTMKQQPRARGPVPQLSKMFETRSQQIASR